MWPERLYQQFSDPVEENRFDDALVLNYNIGFLDVCHRPYKELSEAGIASHERIYQVAMGEVEPFDDVPEYLPKLY